ARHPCREPAVHRAITAQRAVHPQEHLLRNILGLGSVAHKSVAYVVNPARVAAHKFLPGQAIALETTLDQLGILLQASSAPFSSCPLRLNPVGSLGLPYSGTQIAPRMFPIRR